MEHIEREPRPDAIQTVYLRLIQFNGRIFLQFAPLETQENYAMSLESSNRILKSIPVNLVDQVWKDRPQIPADGLTRLPDRVLRKSSNNHKVCVCVFYGWLADQTLTQKDQRSQEVVSVLVLLGFMAAD